MYESTIVMQGKVYKTPKKFFNAKGDMVIDFVLQYSDNIKDMMNCRVDKGAEEFDVEWVLSNEKWLRIKGKLRILTGEHNILIEQYKFL